MKAPTSLLILLVAAMASGPIFGYGLSASSAAVIEHVGISPGQLGWLASISFVTAAVGSLGLGHIADRAGVRTQLVLMHGSSIASLVVAAAATHLWMLVVAAVFAGLPLATGNPTTNRILALGLGDRRWSVRDRPAADRGLAAPWGARGRVTYGSVSTCSKPSARPAPTRSYRRR